MRVSNGKIERHWFRWQSLAIGSVAQWVACSARDEEDVTSWVLVPAAAFYSLRNILEQDIRTDRFRPTQRFIPLGVDKSTTIFTWAWDDGMNIASVGVGCQVKLWFHMTCESRSAETNCEPLTRTLPLSVKSPISAVNTRLFLLALFLYVDCMLC